MTAHIERSLAYVLDSPDFVELMPGALWEIDLRYASANNFVGHDMYGVFNRAFLHRIAADMLMNAVTDLQSRKPGWRFLIFDALRPRSVQRVLWSHVVNTPNQPYIANPDRGSLHNFGFAVDLTLLDASGLAQDMGAGYDDFRDIAQPQLEAQFAREGLLTTIHLNNRLLLRETMESAGFKQLPHEWWHFDARPREDVQARFAIVE